MVKLGLHIFHRDLRINDNYALSKLMERVDFIIPIFILDQNQIFQNSSNLYYYSNNGIQFMCESLIDLNKQTNNHLYIFLGDPITIVKYLIRTLFIECISFNAFYSEFALKRDKEICDFCESEKIETIVEHNNDSLINLDLLLKDSNKSVYTSSTEFINQLKLKNINPMVDTIPLTKLIKLDTKLKYIYDISNLSFLYTHNDKLYHNGGRTNGMTRLENEQFSKNYNYKDDLTISGFQISGYLNFGCVSIREFYYKYMNNYSLTNQLYYRDYNLYLYRFHKLANKYKFIDNYFNKIKWLPRVNEWYIMINCKTGFLLIDAIIMQFKTTGYICNRARLLLATFWIKYLLINPFDPKYGSQVGFSKYAFDAIAFQNIMNNQKIIFNDYELIKNKVAINYNQAVNRIDNAMISQYDSDGVYIKTWLPQYTKLSIEEMIMYPTIFDWKKRYVKYHEMLQYSINS